MKNFMEFIKLSIDVMLDEPIAFVLAYCFITPMWLIVLSISSIITEKLLNVGFQFSHDYFIPIMYIGGIVFSILVFDPKKYMLGMIISSFFIIYIFGQPIEKNTASHVPTPVYSYHREYSPNYYRETPSGSNYRYSDSSSDTMREKTDIPYVSVPENQTIAEKSKEILDKVNIPHGYEALTTPQDSEPENQPVAAKSEEILDKVNIPHEDEDISPSNGEIYLSDDLEYVTSDEQGNKYYINKSFGNYIMTTGFEGTVCHAMFRKILSNGIEVEVSEYEFNQGMVTKQKILAYEDSMIKFRNENGFREFSFSTMSGYASDGSIIVGWGAANFAETHQWKPINDELYNALYDAAYKRVQ